MFRRFFILSLLCLAAVSSAPANEVLTNGEKLSYRVSWGIFINAGFIEITTQAKNTEAGPRFHVTTSTATRGILRGFYAFDGKAESVVDGAGFRLLSVTSDSGTRSERDTYAMAFDYAHSLARYTDGKTPAKTEDLTLPEGDPIDLAMCLMQARLWKMTPGDKRDIVVLFGSDFYNLTVTALRYEQVKTPLATYWTLLLEPRMEKTEPKGMFKKGSGVRVWISQGETPLPVKFELSLKIGTGIAALVGYEVPRNEKNPRP